MTPSWPRRLFTPDRITAAFTVVLALATLALVVTAIFQHFDTIDAVRATNRLAEASESAAKDTRHAMSGQFVLQQRAKLDQTRFNKITDDLQSHNSNFHLPQYPNYTTDADVEEYIVIFEDIGYFVSQGLIEDKMAYDHFSYDIEKAWCNVTVRESIKQERSADKSKIAQSNPVYGQFEKLATEYLKTDGLSCNDLGTAATPAAKKNKMKGSP
jgi:hypothetical protein